MIILSKFDGSVALVNLDSIKYCESTPDTLLHFLNGDTMLVKETLSDVESLARKYQVEILKNSMSKEG